jgi:hypothetical protein
MIGLLCFVLAVLTSPFNSVLIPVQLVFGHLVGDYVHAPQALAKALLNRRLLSLPSEPK